MAGNLVAKVHAECRAEAGDLCAATLVAHGWPTPRIWLICGFDREAPGCRRAGAAARRKRTNFGEAAMAWH